jgi:hypothetical protein
VVGRDTSPVGPAVTADPVLWAPTSLGVGPLRGEGNSWPRSRVCRPAGRRPRRSEGPVPHTGGVGEKRIRPQQVLPERKATLTPAFTAASTWTEHLDRPVPSCPTERRPGAESPTDLVGVEIEM